MGFKSTGVVHSVGETKSLGAGGFTKREVIVEIADNPKYPQLVAFECTKDRCSLLDTVNAGDTVSIEWDLRGREWRSPAGELRYFNTLAIWKIEVQGAKNRSAGGQHGQTRMNESPGYSEDKDSIPF